MTPTQSLKEKIGLTLCISTQSIQDKTTKLESNQNNARGKKNKHDQNQTEISTQGFDIY